MVVAIPPPPYRILRTLRRGHAASVVEATGAEGAPVVVKLANPAAHGADALGAKRFEREIALCAALPHPGLARVLGHGDGWIAFEHLDAPLSDEGVRKRHAPPGAARLLLARLAATLAHLHAQGVVHRDVKPAHVMFRADVPVLIDLGVAGLVADDPLEGTEFVGSPAWMAPEQMDGAAPDEAADIWSLCAIGLWLAAGRALHEGSADDVLAARRGGRGPDPAAMPIPVADPLLASILRAGLGPAQDRPRAAAIALALAGPDQAMMRSTAG
jgi:serine/threonine-protein kinase